MLHSTTLHRCVFASSCVMTRTGLNSWNANRSTYFSMSRVRGRFTKARSCKRRHGGESEIVLSRLGQCGRSLNTRRKRYWLRRCEWRRRVSREWGRPSHRISSYNKWSRSRDSGVHWVLFFFSSYSSLRLDVSLLSRGWNLSRHTLVRWCSSTLGVIRYATLCN